MVAPETCRERGTENSGRIHRGTGKRSAKQNVESDGRSNDEAGNATGSARIDCRGMNDEDEKESQDGFHQNALKGVQRDGELRSSRDDNIASEQAETDQSRTESAEQLRDPVAQRIGHGHVASTNQSKSHGRIKLTPRNVHGGRSKCGNR